MALDFTALNRIAYRGCTTVEDQEQKDRLIDQGYTFVEDAENPFLQATEKPSAPLSTSTDGKHTPGRRQATARKTEAFVSISGTRNYKTLYRAAHDFHQRNNPPTVDRDYWRTHTPGIDETPEAELNYWQRLSEDVIATLRAYQEDNFLKGLLIAIYEELEREYKSARIDAQRAASEAV